MSSFFIVCSVAPSSMRPTEQLSVGEEDAINVTAQNVYQFEV